MLLSSVVCLLVIGMVLLSLAEPVRSAKPPLIIVNGVAGAVLQAKLDDVERPEWYCDKNSDWYTAWVDVVELAPEIIDCLIGDLSLDYDSNSEMLHNRPGVSVRVGHGNFGDLYSIDRLDHTPGLRKMTDYYHQFIEYFKEQDYEGGKNLFAAAYDWRYSMKELRDETKYFVKLTSLIEQAYGVNDNTPVLLIGHSMGAGVTHYFLTHIAEQSWKDKYIAAWLPVAPAYAGAVQATVSLLYGNDMGAAILSATKMQRLCKKMGAIPFLLPRPVVWAPNIITVVTPDYMYSSANVTEMLNARGCEQAAKVYNRDQAMYSDFEAPLVDTFVTYGMNLSTPEQLHFDVNLQDIGADEKAPKPDIYMGNGDGTVNLLSLLAGERWAEKQKNNNYALEHHGMSGAEHMEIVQEERYFKLVEKYIEMYTV